MLDIQQSPLYIAIVVYLVIALLLFFIKPSFFFDDNGELKDLGVDKSETIVSGRNSKEYAIARPCLIDLNGENHLFYCKRESEFSKDYMIFYKKLNPNKKEIAKSNDNFLNIKFIDNLDFKKCQCYPYLIKYSKYVILFYNGLNYGKSGFRIAYKEI